MADIYEEIRVLLIKAMKEYGPDIISPAKVLEVNDDATVKLSFPGGKEIPDARLKSVVKDGGHFLLVPSVGSTILAGRIDSSEEWVIISVDEVDQVWVVIGEATFKMTEEGLLIGKGNNTLKNALKKIIEAVQQVVVMDGNNPDYIKLNDALDDINNILV